MTVPAQQVNTQSNSERHALVAATQCFVLSVVVLLVVAWTAGGGKLLTRQLWMDEIHSWLLITDPDQSRAMSALADGVDFNPPTWFLVTRWLSGSPEVSTEFQIRCLSLLWTVMSIAGLCVILARHFDRLVICAAILLTISQPLLIHHSTEIRFYGFWSTCCIWLCVALQWCPQTRVLRSGRALILAILSFAVCTTHYFGVLSLGLIFLPILWRRWSGWLTELSAMGLGSATGLLCCLQYLPGQKVALTRPTWISPATLPDTIGFLQSLMPTWQLIVCLVAFIVSIRLVMKRRNSGESHATDHRKKRSNEVALLAPLLSLSLMPMVIVAISWCLQPSLVTRYAVVGLPSLAVLAAWIMQGSGPRARVSVIGAACVGLWLGVSHRVDEWSVEENDCRQLVQQIRSLKPGPVILFEDRIQWMPVLHHFPELRGQCVLADFDDCELVKDSSLRIVQRDVGRRIQKWYPMYAMKQLKEFSDSPEFYVIPYRGHNADDLLYSGLHVAERCSQDVFRRVGSVVDKQGKQGVSEIREETF
jgi:uncharacterized membrane protein